MAELTLAEYLGCNKLSCSHTSLPNFTPDSPIMSSSSTAAALSARLESITAGSFAFSEQSSFVTVSSTDTVQAAFKALLDNRVQSAPVYHGITGEWLGFVDLGDFAKYISKCLHVLMVLYMDWYKRTGCGI